jgi:hypothetical protein
LALVVQEQQTVLQLLVATAVIQFLTLLFLLEPQAVLLLLVAVVEQVTGLVLQMANRPQQVALAAAVRRLGLQAAQAPTLELLDYQAKVTVVAPHHLLLEL